MKTRLFATLFASSCLLSSAFAYDFEQFVKDTNNDPELIYDELHPVAKTYIDRGIELYQTSSDYREEKWVEFASDPAKLSPAKIWATIWADSGYGEIYSEGYAIVNTFDKGDFRFVVAQELGYETEVLMLDVITFRKDGEDYRFYPPGWIMEYFSPPMGIGGDGVIDPETLEAFLKEAIESQMSEEHINAQSPEEFSELIQKIVSKHQAENSEDASDDLNDSSSEGELESDQ